MKVVYLLLISSIVTFNLMASQLKDLSTKLAFTSAVKDIDSYKTLTLTQSDYQDLAKLFSDQNLMAIYENDFLQVQEYCYMSEDLTSDQESKCDEILEHFFNLSEAIHGSSQQVDGLEELIGTGQDAFDGVVVTENYAQDADPHDQLLKEADSTPNRNSVLLKAHVTPKKEKIVLNLKSAYCHLEQYKTVEIDTDILKANIEYLEKQMIDQSTPLTEQKKIYCLLNSYYEETGDIDRIIDFLLLNAPDGDNFCD